MKKILILISIILVVGFFFVLHSERNLGSVFEKCMETGISQSVDPQNLEGADEYAARAGVKVFCKILVEDCAKIPEGEICAGYNKRHPGF